MVKTTTLTQELKDPTTIDTKFGELQFHLLNPESHHGLVKIDSLSSNSTDLSVIKLKKPLVVQFMPKEDTISVVIKVIQPTGLGPFTCGKEALLGICSVNHDAPLWTTGQTGTSFTCINVKRSLLAKHAFGIIDTSSLESLQFITLDEPRSKLLNKKLKLLSRNTDSTRALDIRLAHLLLSICEGATTEPDRDSVAEKLWRCLQATPSEELSPSLLQAQCDISNTQMNHLFKRATGLSTRQFITHYRLGHIRRELEQNRQPFSYCVSTYGYSSPDQLYRAYRKLFSAEPPLNIH